MRRPDFFLVGAPKCGTTAMYSYLGRHPEVFMCPVKEPEFFSRDPTPGDPGPSLEEYLAHFAGARRERRVGEASVGYLASGEAPRRIKAFEPAARILIMLRNPVEMLHSLHGQRLYNGDEDVADFEEVLSLEPERARGVRLPPGVRTPGQALYRPAARYTEQVRRYLDAFGRGSVHVVIFDDFVRDQAGVFAEVLRFLDVRPDFRTRFDVVNPHKVVYSAGARDLLRHPPGALHRLVRATLSRPARRKLARWFKRLNVRYAPRPPMNAALRRRLQVEFAGEVERLGELVGRDLSAWSRE